MREGAEIILQEPVTIEQNVGLYGGAYRGMVGGKRSSGLATVGAFTYSYSALPEGIVVGRYCSISSGLRFLDSSHPIETVTSSSLMFRPRNHLFKDFVTPELRKFSSTFSVVPSAFPEIGHDVWIGANVTLSPKINVGTGGSHRGGVDGDKGCASLCNRGG